jgi:hypothetical protein
MRPQYETSHAVDASKTSKRPKKDLGGREIEKALPARPFSHNLSASLVMESVICMPRGAPGRHTYSIYHLAQSRRKGYRNSSGGISVDTRKFLLFILSHTRSSSLISPPLYSFSTFLQRLSKSCLSSTPSNTRNAYNVFINKPSIPNRKIPLEVADSQVNQSRLSAAGQLSVAMGNHKQGLDPLLSNDRAWSSKLQPRLHQIGSWHLCLLHAWLGRAGQFAGRKRPESPVCSSVMSGLQPSRADGQYRPNRSCRPGCAICIDSRFS